MYGCTEMFGGGESAGPSSGGPGRRAPERRATDRRVCCSDGGLCRLCLIAGQSDFGWPFRDGRFTLPEDEGC